MHPPRVHFFCAKEQAMKRFTPVVLAAGLFAASAAQAAPATWITLGDAAYAKLREAVPQVASKMSKQGTGKEKIHLVQIDDDAMLKLSAAIHKDLKRCGGFIAHASEEEGRQAIAKASVPMTLASSRPSYA